ncbi:MAG: 30S ribosome-binding factor RbfA [Gammaproteobacteria bacterium]|nr:30S ribosome-binding factor RbfA [Gammaproteobacteria bacterium]
MVKESSRTYRVADQIQRELADILRKGVKDPRLPEMVTISDVSVSRDLSVATIYFTLVDEERRQDADFVLNRAAGFIRTELSRRIQLRSVPQLRFRYDDSIEKGEHIESLIQSALESDRSSRH